jgi:ribosome-binding factor A
MGNRRQHRVEELIRRELAQMLLRGELRDPRLSPASAVSITGVDVSADLSVARVYVDVLTEALRLEDVLDALASATGLLRHKLGERLELRRTPELRFARDESIARGARVEAILTELRESGEFEAATEGRPVPLGDDGLPRQDQGEGDDGSGEGSSGDGTRGS